MQFVDLQRSNYVKIGRGTLCRSTEKFWVQHTRKSMEKHRNDPQGWQQEVGEEALLLVSTKPHQKCTASKENCEENAGNQWAGVCCNERCKLQ